ncbi:protein-lysine N-methyltransferase CG9154 [Culicoides brevitarsis]|uniref:protein-lysine N-methyltransferase CG9154 n=1 Tax=Culicoides brevitarsis TaxID=469753 RepID=UPI00307BC7AC
MTSLETDPKVPEMDDDDDCKLPADTLAILQQFLKEQSEKKDDIQEDWQLSQFWYNDATKSTLSKAFVKILAKYHEKPEDCQIALMSCPSLYPDTKKLHEKTTIFEFDARFSKYDPDFVQYDYNLALTDSYLDEHAKRFDLIVLDPPFLSDECLEKSSILCQKIAKNDAKIILCTGKVMSESVPRFMKDLKACKFEPQHERNLGNDFGSFANFDLDSFL